MLYLFYFAKICCQTIYGNDMSMCIDQGLVQPGQSDFDINDVVLHDTLVTFCVTQNVTLDIMA